jgi:hypothetical protein
MLRIISVSFKVFSLISHRIWECIHSEGGQILIIHLTNDIYRKYHSGWMCTGATRGFAGVKLSGSIKMYSSLGLILLIL